MVDVRVDDGGDEPFALCVCGGQCTDLDFGEYHWKRALADPHDQWWVPVMPSTAFLRDGLVHVSRYYDGSQAFCGVEAVPYGVELCSTDEVAAYAAMVAAMEIEVTCLTCLVYEGEVMRARAYFS